MYHPPLHLKYALSPIILGCFTTLFIAAVPTSALDTRTGGVRQTVVAEEKKAPVGFKTLPKRSVKARPSTVVIFELDEKPLGERQPFLLVHGLRGEYYPSYRWAKVIKRLNADKDFSGHFKIYMARYDTLSNISQTVPSMQAALAKLYEASNQRPIRVMALSIGGNLVYESMLDVQTDKQVSLLMALGTPFLGTPLFNADWLLYGMYKNLATPWERIDHAIAYRLYFAKNRSLQTEFAWVNSDQAIPDVGRFSSLLPFGPKGDLNANASANKRLFALDQHAVDHKKLITYGGYLLSPYLKSKYERRFETAILYPYDLVTVELPAHLLREHPVLKLLNQAIAAVPATAAAEVRAHTRYVYGLNDGITPVASALFLPQSFCASRSLSLPSDVLKAKDAIDVKTARVFRNIDHLSFIDGTQSILKFGGSSTLKDELNPQDGEKDIFGWMLSDLNHSFEESNEKSSEQRKQAALNLKNQSNDISISGPAVSTY